MNVADCNDTITLPPTVRCYVPNRPCLVHFKPAFVINRAGIDTDYVITYSNLKTLILLCIALSVM
jgi:hypothetical protein